MSIRWSAYLILCFHFIKLIVSIKFVFIAHLTVRTHAIVFLSLFYLKQMENLFHQLMSLGTISLFTRELVSFLYLFLIILFILKIPLFCFLPNFKYFQMGNTLNLIKETHLSKQNRDLASVKIKGFIIIGYPLRITYLDMHTHLLIFLTSKVSPNNFHHLSCKLLI